MNILNVIKVRLKWLLFPGVNLHGRLRYQFLPKFFARSDGDIPFRVLDAGCGNGMLAYQSYKRGSTVTGVTFKSAEVHGCKFLFNQHLAIPEDQLEFRQGNLYELDFPDEAFDEIICAEVLEHLIRDMYVCQTFWRILKPGGVVHICAPNSEHPYNASFPLDKHERGGHVRAGYTLETYSELLEPLGFKIESSAGLGGPVRQWFNWRIKVIQKRLGAVAGLPLFLAAMPFLILDRFKTEKNPFSIYVKAVKPSQPGFNTDRNENVKAVEQ